MSRHTRSFPLVTLLLMALLLPGCGQIPDAVQPGQASSPTPEPYPPPWPTGRAPSTEMPTWPPTPESTRPPTPTPLVVQPTPYAPDQSLPEDLPPILYAVHRPYGMVQIWTLHYEQGLLREELLVDFGTTSVRDTLSSANWMPYGQVQEMSLSPTGQYIAVTLSGPENAIIASAIVDRNGIVSLPSIPGNGPAWILNWLAGKDEMLILNKRGRLYGTMQADGGKSLNFPIADPPWLVHDAVATPNGQSVIISTQESTLRMVSIDGSQVDNLATPETKPSNDVGGFTWSPDGRHLAFIWLTGGLGYLEGTLGLMNADGTEPRVLGRSGTYDFDPGWSPDGTRLIFARMENPDNIDAVNPSFLISSLWLIDVTTGQEQLVLASGGQYSHWSPVWLPDGSGLIFLSNRGGESNLWFTRPDGTGLQQLTRQGGLEGIRKSLVLLSK